MVLTGARVVDIVWGTLVVKVVTMNGLLAVSGVGLGVATEAVSECHYGGRGGEFRQR
jgi:hypothetical protein